MGTDQWINADLSRRAWADTAAMDWVASPSGTVWRKRVHLVGPAEAGQVTSLVRYQPDATFPLHDHPDGEEILVLDGVFSDEHGDWPAGTYLLNPEGFRHAPFSKPGCLLFVKLRQYPGRDRAHVALASGELAWQPGGRAGLATRQLYQQPGYADRTRLERWAPGFSAPATPYPGGAELFVLEGAYSDQHGRYRQGAWQRLPAGAVHEPATDVGCILYVKTGGLRYLHGG